MTIKTRFAPSPSGALHLGGARTALYNWLLAKKNAGHFYLRFEDSDSSRSKKESIRKIIEAIDWLQLDYHNEIIYQSNRFEEYSNTYQYLLEKKYAYYCDCTVERLDALKKSSNNKYALYDGKCRELNIPHDGSAVLRLNTHTIVASLKQEDIYFYDSLKGKISKPIHEIGDFVIRRADSTPIFHFAVVVDDIFQGITHVIRGDDHTINTLKHLLLYHALGKKPPKYTHLPLLLNSEKKVLSKRDQSADILKYKQMGYLPQAVKNYLLRLGWSNKNIEFLHSHEMIEQFSLKKLNKSSCIINDKKLLWLNKEHIRHADVNDIAALININYTLKNHKEIINLIKSKSETLLDVEKELKNYINKPHLIKSEFSKLVPANRKTTIIAFLNEIIRMLATIDDWNNINLKQVINLAKESNNVELREIGPIIRYSLLGKIQAPSLERILYLLGKDESISRIKLFIEQYL